MGCRRNINSNGHFDDLNIRHTLFILEPIVSSLLIITPPPHQISLSDPGLTPLSYMVRSEVENSDAIE